MPTRVLIAGPSGPVVDRLRQGLQATRGHWEVLSSETAAAAQLVLGALAVDAVVVTDELDPAAARDLLAHLRQGHPDVARVAITHVDAPLDAHVSLLPGAVAAQLVPRIEAAVVEVATRTAQRGVPVEALVGSVDQLPSSPALWTKMRQMIADPDVDTRHLADVVGRDVGTSAKVLRLVNSAFYGLPRHVSDIREAINLLGISAVSSLVLSAEVLTAFQRLRTLPGLDVDALCTHGLATGAAARLLVPNKAQADDAFVAGLLQDVGQLALASAVTDGFRACLAESAWRGAPLHEVERERLGYDHAQAGAELLVLWQMSEPVVDAVGRSHTALPAELDALDVSSSTRLAHCLTTVRWTQWRDHSERGDLAPLVEETSAALDSLGLAEEVEELGLSLAGELSATASALQT